MNSLGCLKLYFYSFIILSCRECEDNAAAVDALMLDNAFDLDQLFDYKKVHILLSNFNVKRIKNGKRKFLPYFQQKACIFSVAGL